MSSLIDPVINGLGLRNGLGVINEARIMRERGDLAQITICLRYLLQCCILVAIQLDDPSPGVRVYRTGGFHTVGPSVDLVALGFGLPVRLSGRDLANIIANRLFITLEYDAVRLSDPTAPGA